jgi:hypothetical protein
MVQAGGGTKATGHPGSGRRIGSCQGSRRGGGVMRVAVDNVPSGSRSPSGSSTVGAFSGVSFPSRFEPGMRTALQISVFHPRWAAVTRSAKTPEISSVPPSPHRQLDT